MNHEGYRQFKISNFSPSEDRLYSGDIVPVEISYTGEPRSYE